jgi:hypothetical protein
LLANQIKVSFAQTESAPEPKPAKTTSLDDKK